MSATGAGNSVPTTSAAALAPDYQAIVNAPDRSAEDRGLDVGRHPIELLQFLDVRPGMRVAELGAGIGYTAELLGRAVAPNGRVYAQNPQFVLSRFAERPRSERLAKPVMKDPCQSR
jgi:predicted methyltransferase